MAFTKAASTWQAASFLCLIVAVACRWRDYADAAFVAAALGLAAWFVSFRQRLRSATVGADAGASQTTKEDFDDKEV